MYLNLPNNMKIDWDTARHDLIVLLWCWGVSSLPIPLTHWVRCLSLLFCISIFDFSFFFNAQWESTPWMHVWCRANQLPILEYSKFLNTFLLTLIKSFYSNNYLRKHTFVSQVLHLHKNKQSRVVNKTLYGTQGNLLIKNITFPPTVIWVVWVSKFVRL